MKLLNSSTWFDRSFVLSQKQIDEKLSKLKKLQKRETTFLQILMMWVPIIAFNVTLFVGLGLKAAFGLGILALLFSAAAQLIAHWVSHLVTDDPVWYFKSQRKDYDSIYKQCTSLQDRTVESRADYCGDFKELLVDYPEMSSYCALVIKAERPLLYGDYVMCQQWAEEIDDHKKQSAARQRAQESCASLHNVVVKLSDNV